MTKPPVGIAVLAVLHLLAALYHFYSAQVAGFSKFALAMGLLDAIVGVGLWRLLNWARFLAIALAIFEAAPWLYFTPLYLAVLAESPSWEAASFVGMQVWQLGLNLWIIGYLLLHPRVKQVFDGRKRLDVL